MARNARTAKTTSPVKLAGLPPKVGRSNTDFDLEDQLLAELAPNTGYEWVLARNLIANEFQAEQIRHRRERLLRHRAGDMIALQLTRCMDPDAPDRRRYTDEQIVLLVRAWISGLAEAAQEIAENGIDEDRFLTDAFLERCAILKMLDDEIAQLEGRRRRLLKDYRELQAKHSTDDRIEDAEVVE